MIDALHIPLAAGDGDLTETLVILGFVVLSIIGGLIQKASKAKAERKEQQQPRRPAHPPTEPQPRRQRAPGQADGLQMLQPAPGAALPEVKPSARTALGGRLKPKKTSVESRHVGSARVGSTQVGRLRHVEQGQRIDLMVHVNLASGDAARRAIIFHEIFSPPKALRRSAELWEM